MKRLEEERICGKTLHICYNNEEHPVFYLDPTFIIVRKDTKVINDESDITELKIKQMIKAYSSKLSLIDKVDIMRNAGAIKYQLFHFETFEDEIALAPEVPLLDTLFHFCRENNCYDIFERTLNMIIDYYLANEIYPIVCEPGLMKIIKSEPNISFVWHNVWDAKCKRRMNEKI